jgi:hypothetical protein
MKATIVALAAAGFVAAQDFSGQPECALPCLMDAIQQIDCAATDSACLCQEDTQAELRGIVAPCLLDACSPQDLLRAQQAAGEACAQQSESGSPSSTASETGTSSTATETDMSSTGTDTTMVTPTTTEVTETFTTTDGESTMTGTTTTTVVQTTGTDGMPTPTDGGDDEGAAGRGPVAGLLAALLAFAVAL